MEVVHYTEPVQFCIIKNYYLPDQIEAIHKELDHMKPSLKGPDGTFSARNSSGELLKKNKGGFVQNKSGPIWNFSRKLFGEVSWELRKGHWFWQYLNLTLEDEILVTHYESGDYYKSHRDESLFTAIYYTWKEPKTFTGGDVFFGEFKVPIENNCLLVFPGPTFHEVSTVYGNGRWAISQFVKFGVPRHMKKNMYHYDNFLHATDYKKVQNLVFNSDKWFLGNSSLELYPRFWKLPLDNNEYIRSLINSVLEEHNLKILRVYANGQFYGQNGSFHQDDPSPSAWTFLLYLNDIERGEIDEWMGTTEFKTENGITSQQPIPNMGILFRSDLFHRGLAPSRMVTDMRVTLAWKLGPVAHSPLVRGDQQLQGTASSIQRT